MKESRVQVLLTTPSPLQRLFHSLQKLLGAAQPGVIDIVINPAARAAKITRFRAIVLFLFMVCSPCVVRRFHSAWLC
jgi:hypothetical protein